ncbi:Protein of unknown function [Gryllus bimaculatus]|nr:Protein of unknown function [Gryllus bimaculatus]
MLNLMKDFLKNTVLKLSSFFLNHHGRKNESREVYNFFRNGFEYIGYRFNDLS